MRIKKDIYRIVTVYIEREMKEIERDIEGIIEYQGKRDLIIRRNFNARIGRNSEFYRVEETTSMESKDKLLKKAEEIFLELLGERAWYMLNGNTKGESKRN